MVVELSETYFILTNTLLFLLLISLVHCVFVPWTFVKSKYLPCEWHNLYLQCAYNRGGGWSAGILEKKAPNKFLEGVIELEDLLDVFFKIDTKSNINILKYKMGYIDITECPGEICF